jgi:hypothetical protein
MCGYCYVVPAVTMRTNRRDGSPYPVCQVHADLMDKSTAAAKTKTEQA